MGFALNNRDSTSCHIAEEERLYKAEREVILIAVVGSPYPSKPCLAIFLEG